MSYFTTSLLLLLTLQRSSSSILLHEAGQDYSTSLAILLGELMKQGICIVVGLYQVYQDTNTRLPSVYESTNYKRRMESFAKELKEALKQFVTRAISREAWKVFLPAALYVVQNNLYLYSSARLQPSTFQALWQLRLIPTAYLSQVLLEKKLGLKRWLALCIILVGVVAIQQGQNATLSSLETETDKKTKIMAITALMLAAIVASLAGVLLEKVFKQKETNLWIANFQLSTFSIAPATFVLFVECEQSTQFLNPLKSFGFSFWPWITVLIQGAAGILVALTTKYAGCIAGSISGIAAIAVTHLIEIVRGTKSTSTGELTFFFGFSLVAAGVTLYTLLPASTPIQIMSDDLDSEFSQFEDSTTLIMTDSPVKEKSGSLVIGSASPASPSSTSFSFAEKSYSALAEEEDDQP